MRKLKHCLCAPRLYWLTYYIQLHPFLCRCHDSNFLVNVSSSAIKQEFEVLYVAS